MRKMLSLVRCYSVTLGFPEQPRQPRPICRQTLSAAGPNPKPAFRCGLIQFSPAVVETRQAKRFLVSGTVQGVGFRYFAKRAADWLGLAGYARNLRDGRVEVYAVGSRVQLAELRRELEHGPLGANVETVSEEVAQLAPNFRESFSIERDA